jgi:hypothetical protein
LRDSGNYATLNSASHYGHWAAVIGTPPGQAAADVVAMIIGTAHDEDDAGGGDDAGGDDAILPMGEHEDSGEWHSTHPRRGLLPRAGYVRGACEMPSWRTNSLAAGHQSCA